MDVTERTTNPSQTPTNISFYPFASKYGLIAGLIMAVLLFLINYGEGSSTALQFSKYIALGGVLYYALSVYKKSIRKESIFKEDMQVGGMITIVAALTLLVASFVFFMMGLGISKFSKETITFPDFLLIGGTEFFITIVAGMILTFISLQFLKEKSRS